MSLEEHKAALARAFKAFGDLDLGVIDEVYSPEYEFDAPPLKGSSSSSSSGREAFKQRVVAFSDSFANVKYNIDDIIAEGELVATFFSFEGLHQGEFVGFPATNKQVKVTGIHFSRFVDGKIKKTWAGFTNIAEALKPDKAVGD